MADTGFTGADALAYLKRLLAIENITQDNWDSPALYDFLSEGRDMVMQTLSMAAPVTVRTFETMTDNGDDTFTLGTDPYRILELRHKTTKLPMVPSSALDQDTGDYEWIDPRNVRVSAGLTPTGGIEAIYVPAQAAMAANTAANLWGIPQTCHRLACKGAALIALGTDEDFDPTNIIGLFQNELSKIEVIYSEFDAMAGLGMREAFLHMYGEWMADSTY